jgi:hypothetical protein
MRVLKLYNIFHLGDHIFNIILFYNIKEYIEQNDIFIDYYCYKEYHEQLIEYNCSKNIKFRELPADIPKDFFNLWLGSDDLETNWGKEKAKNIMFDEFFVKLFNEFLEKQNIPIRMNNLEYTEPELLERYERINKKFDNKFAELDYLIINSTPRSNQYDKNNDEWNRLAHKLHEKFKIATTEKVEGLDCTCDESFTVKDIAAISTRAKKIIAVNSGVLPVLFNSYTLKNVQVVYYFDYRTDYKNPKFIKPKDNNINEIYALENIELPSKIESFDNNENIFLMFLCLFLILLFVIYYKKIKYFWINK